MRAERRKWLAIGKQEIMGETKSLLQLPRKRFHSQSHSSLGRQGSPMTTKSVQSLTRNKSSIQLLSLQLIEKLKAQQSSQGENSGEITINILSLENKSGQIEKQQSVLSQVNSLAQLTEQITSHLPCEMKDENTVQIQGGSMNFLCGHKELEVQQEQISFNENSGSIIKPITNGQSIQQLQNFELELKTTQPQHNTQHQIIQSSLPLNLQNQQQPTSAMSHNHVPFYLRNQNYAEYLIESSQASAEEVPFGDELNQSVVIETQDISLDLAKHDQSVPRLSSNAYDEESQIIEQMSFADSSKQKDPNDQPIKISIQGYSNKQLGSYNVRPPISKQATNQNNHKKFIAKVKLSLNELSEMTQNLKITHRTIVKEVEACQSKGAIPLFIKNPELQQRLVLAFKDIVARSSRAYADKELHRQNETLGKLLNAAIEKGLLGEGSFKELDNTRKIAKMVNRLEENSREIFSLRESLSAAQSQCDKTSKVLLSKLDEVNEMKQRLSKREAQSLQAIKPTPVPTFSPDFEKLLRQKEIKSSEMARQIESLKERNEQLLDEKQKLQQEVFTLQQRVIGVQMQIEQKVRQGIQEIRPVVEDQMRNEYLKDEQAKDVTTNNQFFLETIDTLSQEIKDLTEKCKYYENHIHNQEKPSPKLNISQQHQKDMEELIEKRLAELDMQENTLLTIETELTFKDKKLKELEYRINREASNIQKRERQCAVKQEQMEKYLQELNAREEELYGWQKQLGQEEKKLSRKIAQLQRQKAIFDNQKNMQPPIMASYSNNPIMENRSILGQYNSHQYSNGRQYTEPSQYQPPHQYSNTNQFPSHYSNSSMIKQQMPTLQNFQMPQPRINSYRAQSYHVATEPAYHPTYNQESIAQQQKFSRNLDRQNQQNMSQQYIRYDRLQSSDDIKESEQMDHSDLDIGELRVQAVQVESVRGNPLDSERSHTEANQNRLSKNRVGVQKLYLSSTYDKKSQMVEEILAKRRNQSSILQNRNERADSKSPVSNSRNHLHDFFKRSDAKKSRSPIKNDLSYQNMKEITERKLKERFEKRKMYEKPSKDMSDFYRPVNSLTSPISMHGNKKYQGYDFGQDNMGNSERPYTNRSYFKASIPAPHNINEKLQKLKEQIKRQVRDLE